MELTKKERLFLYNQYEILKHLNPEEKEDYEKNQEIVYNGFKHNYNNLIEHFGEETPEEVSEFVYDVLQMYRCINDSYYSLCDEEKEEYNKLNTTFEGFDGNEEPQYYWYACFLLQKLKIYEESYKDGKIDTNSHWNKIDRYTGMISRWKEVRTGKYDKLSLENIRYIVSRY
ncbi:YfbU family protein [Clostridium taeniosporum]|uniref:YfbU family protein n=1 Tax=Clostridium taeniosporum TaxID=394958 RepID=A0A1D7XM97_9CLOT|nr:YfbU family protein [Clostridium taeniosporum]AOR24310.1 hypothetical protein BGI42_11445 [Clostridium taeniosporum]